MYHIIFNPVAGKKKSSKRLEEVKKIFAERGVQYEVHESCKMGDAKEIASALTKQGATDLIVIGGDGTLHEVLNGLSDPAKCRLGLIPAGTGNDFAEKAKIPLNTAKAVELILRGEAKPTDYLQVGKDRCMNVAGMGMDVDVLERCQKGKMKGKLKYLMSLLQSLFAFKGYRIEIKSDGVEETRDVLIAAACNGTQFGGGITICPVAEIDDGKIDVMVVDCIGGKLKLIGAFMELMKGKILEYPAAKHFRCDEVKFISNDTNIAQFDGELYRDIDFTVTIGKGLRFFRA